MKVVFLEDVEGTAQVGDVKDVKNGFARNYLLPRRLAAPAVEPYLARARSRAVREAQRQEGLDQEATAAAERLEGARISITARVGEQDKLYGSITSVHIAQEVARLIGEDEFDHRKVLLPEAIKEVGVQPIRLRLTRNVEATIELEVLAEGEPEEEAAEAQEAPTDEIETAEDAIVAEEQETAEPVAEVETSADEIVSEEEPVAEQAEEEAEAAPAAEDEPETEAADREEAVAEEAEEEAEPHEDKEPEG